MPAVEGIKDFSKLLADIPRGSWVALSRDEERVICYDAQLSEALKRADELGETDPVVIRVPDAANALFL